MGTMPQNIRPGRHNEREPYQTVPFTRLDLTFPTFSVPPVPSQEPGKSALPSDLALGFPVTFRPLTLPLGSYY